MFKSKKTHGLPNDPSILEYMRSISTTDIAKPDVVYISDWFDKWLTNYTVHLQPATIHSYRVNSDCHIKRVLGHLRMSELTFEDCQLFINSLMIGYGIPAALKPKTIHNIQTRIEDELESELNNE